MTRRHRPVLIVTGGFFVLLLALWVFDLRVQAERRAEARESLEKLGKFRDSFTNPAAPFQVEPLLRRTQTANAQLREEWDTLREKLLFEFPPLFPSAAEEARPASWARERHRTLVEQVGRELETGRGIEIEESARNLGFTFKVATTEALADDILWLKQMTVVKRFIDLLGSLGLTADGQPHVRRLLSIRAEEPVPIGSPAPYLEEWPVKASVLLTRTGLDELLVRCSEPGTFHRVITLTVNAAPGERRAQEVQKRVGERLHTWYEHYYHVELRVAALVPAVAAEEPVAGEGAQDEDERNAAPPARRPGRIRY